MSSTERCRISCSISHVAQITATGHLVLQKHGSLRELGAPELIGDETWCDVACGNGFIILIRESDKGLFYMGNLAMIGGKWSAPNKCIPLFPGTRWRMVAAGPFHAAGVQEDWTFCVWGRGAQFMGEKETIGEQLPLIQSYGKPRIYTQIACGGSFAAGLSLDGRLWLWGLIMDYNAYAPVQTTGHKFTSPTYVNEPKQRKWTLIASSGSHLLGASSDGSLYLWGPYCKGDLRIPPEATTPWTNLACGTESCTAIDSAGAVYQWWFDKNGQERPTCTPLHITAHCIAQHGYLSVATIPGSTGAVVIGLNSNT